MDADVKMAPQSSRYFAGGVRGVVFCIEVCHIALAGPIPKTYPGRGHNPLAKQVSIL